MRTAHKKRIREFTSVRACAEIALAKLGFDRASMVPCGNGEPVWPCGIVGSMGVIHGGLFVSLVGASAVSGENWVTTLDSLGEAADALRVYHGAVR
ncbi:hypothetical protein [Actinomyces slackii]